MRGSWSLLVALSTVCGCAFAFPAITTAQNPFGRFGFGPQKIGEDNPWKKHVVYQGEQCVTAVAGDFTGDKKIDIIANAGGKTRLFAAPDWKETVLAPERSQSPIHSEVLDCDGDGDLDYIGAEYSPGVIYWLECPKRPQAEPWRWRLIDSQVNGIHGVLVGDVDSDGQPDLMANSAQPKGPLANSVVYYRVPKDAKSRDGDADVAPFEANRDPEKAANAGKVFWPRTVVAKGDAPGLSHYLGLGDVNGDGRPDIACAAKGGEQDPSGLGEWFAYWEAPSDPHQDAWKKHFVGEKYPGATNILPADVDGDGRLDWVASCGHGFGVFWFRNRLAAGASWKASAINPMPEGCHDLQVADLDNDGDMDVASVAKDTKVALVFLNDGRGYFTTQVIGKEQAAYDLRAVDLDGDGDKDLLVAGQESKNVVWYENPTK